MGRKFARLSYIATWVFVIGITAFDIYYAVINRDTIELWESNPVMLWVISVLGLAVAAGFRAGTVMVACAIMRFATPRSKWAGTAVAAAAHGYLAFLYVAILFGVDIGS